MTTNGASRTAWSKSQPFSARRTSTAIISTQADPFSARAKGVRGQSPTSRHRAYGEFIELFVNPAAPIVDEMACAPEVRPPIGGAASIASDCFKTAFQNSDIICVHTIAHAVGALKAAAWIDRCIALVSAPDAGIYAGPGWFGALVDSARQAVPNACFSAWLDCGDRPGAALAAIRAPVEGIIFTGRSDVARRLADLARKQNVRFLTERPVAGLDFGSDFFGSVTASEERCAAFLAGSRC